MKRTLFALFLASSVLAIAQVPAKAGQTKVEKKAEKKAAKKTAKEAKATAAPAPAPVAKPAPMPAAQPAPAPAARPVPAPRPTPAAKAVPVATTIVANKDSKTYHRADCAYVTRMKEANRVGFATAAEAAKAGYKPCKVCKPK